MPRLSQIIFPRGLAAPSASSTQDIFIGQLGGLISTTIEHVIAPDIRYFQKVQIPCFIQSFFIIWWMNSQNILPWSDDVFTAVSSLSVLFTFQRSYSKHVMVPSTKEFSYYATLVCGQSSSVPHAYFCLLTCRLTRSLYCMIVLNV